MRRWLNVLRVTVFPRLCRSCLTVLERSLEDLAALRFRHRELGYKMRRQRALAPRLCNELLAQPPDRRRLQILSCYVKYRSRPLAEEFLRRSLARAHDSGEEALELADLAWEIADRLLGVHDLAGGLLGVSDTKALAAAHRGNAYRVLCRWKEAEDEIERASSHLLQGSGDPEVFGDVLSLSASLNHDRQRHTKALEQLAQAQRLFGEAGADRKRGKVMLQRGLVLRAIGEPDQARIVLEDLLRGLDATTEPKQASIAEHNLAVALIELRRFEEAEDALDRAEALTRRFHSTDRNNAAYFTWTRGKILRGLGFLDDAHERLEAARESFRQARNPYETALVGLDLASLLLAQGRLGDLAALAEDVHAELQGQQLHAEAERALLLFLEAARRQQAVEAVIQVAATQLTRFRCARASGTGR